MDWSEEANAAISKVPFFVRKRVRKKVEEQARRSGSDRVTIAHVKETQARFMGNMEKEIKGYQVENCFGPSGCPNRIGDNDKLTARIEEHLASLHLKDFLHKRVNGPLKMHHEFRISLSDCPNGCSRPQIVDVGLLGASPPKITAASCSQCNSCVENCREAAITLSPEGPIIDFTKCLFCGHCHRDCPTGTIIEGKQGYRVLVGGKLGRHPQLAHELPGIFNAEEALSIIKKCLELFMTHFRGSERFGDILNRVGLNHLMEAEKNSRPNS